MGFERKTDILANGLVLLKSAAAICGAGAAGRAAGRAACSRGQRFLQTAGKPLNIWNSLLGHR